MWLLLSRKMPRPQGMKMLLTMLDVFNRLLLQACPPVGHRCLEHQLHHGARVMRSTDNHLTISISITMGLVRWDINR